MEFFFSFGLIVLFLVLTAIYAGSETGFVSLDLNHLKFISSNPKAKFERQLLNFVKNPERFLVLTLIGINMSIVISTSLLTNILQKKGPLWVSLGTGILSVIIFLFCEVIPKICFSSSPLRLSLKFLPLIQLTDKILAIPIVIFTAFTRKAMDAFGIRSDGGKRKISRDELLILLRMGASSGVITEKPHRMAKGIIGLKGTRVSEIMVPRTKIDALDVAWSIPKAKKTLIESGYSRIPVFEGSIDHIIGIVYFKDLLLRGHEKQSLREFMGEVVFVPETKNAYELFQEMLTRRFQTAVVLNEYGAPSGLVALEDLIEEVVGEIHDEHDEAISGVKVHSDGSMTVRAEISLSDLHEQTGIVFSNFDGITTFNGVLLAALGKIPIIGECLEIQGWAIEILQADQRRVILVRVHSLAE